VLTGNVPTGPDYKGFHIKVPRGQWRLVAQNLRSTVTAARAEEKLTKIHNVITRILLKLTLYEDLHKT